MKIVDCLLTDPTPFVKAPTDTPDPTWAPDMLQLFVQEQVQYNFNLGYADFVTKYSNF